MSERHSLLKRQLKRHFGTEPVPEVCDRLLDAVDSAYREFDADRGMLERSLELSSQELLNASADMRAIFQAIPDLFFRIDAEGRILDCRAGRLADFLIPPKELVGKRIQKVPSPEARQRIEHALAQVKISKLNQTIEYVLRFGGVDLYYEARFLPLRNGQIIVMIRNITERKRMESSLMFADRMASIGTLAAGVAHEVNTPLTYALANLRFAIAQLESWNTSNGIEGAKALGPVCDALKEAEEGAERASQIASDLRAFSHGDEERREPVDVREILDLAVKMAQAEIRYRARLIRRYGEVPLVDANPGRVGQVFLNVLINAAQAITEGRADENEICVVTRTDEHGRAAIEISDTGCGIREADLPRIFDPFFTTKPAGVGTGLGLAIGHGIVRALGGEMEVESREGGGSLFRILLPASEREERVARRQAAVGQQRFSTRSRILVLDDEEKIGIGIGRALEDAHDVVSSTNPIEVLDRLARGERFDLLLCDLMMPEMSGVEFLSRLRSVAPDQIERLVLTSTGGFSPGVRSFLQQLSLPKLEKPIDIPQLMALIRKQSALAAEASAQS